MSEQSIQRAWYIAVEGVIGVGKTTLARLLRDQFGTGLLLEVFEENPFLSRFYADRARYAFQTQMFFLLSRYRQQQQGVPRSLAQGPLVSDYMFAKDKLFARLNLVGDEWEMYQRIQEALAEQIPKPDLIIFLYADTDVLMGRIAQRDRPYERDMDRDYISSLQQSYQRFFDDYEEGLVLRINTNTLNYVTQPSDLTLVVDRIRNALQEGTFQRTLPHFETGRPDKERLSQGRPLAEYQQFHVELDRKKHFHTDPFFNFMCLSEEIGELGSEYAKLWLKENTMIAEGRTSEQARRAALEQHRPTLESELADCMAYLLKLANYADIDLETAYLRKMNINQGRSWRDSPKVA